MKTIAFFYNKSGVRKTSLVYHLAWMFADRGISTLDGSDSFSLSSGSTWRSKFESTSENGRRSL
jgi:cellulose biosynthesis protein BcsQ